jgi:hypothetical protein
MDAEPLVNFKYRTSKGHIVEVVVWRVPRPVAPSQHPFKYRAAYVVNGERVVGFDNERGKGDHAHIAGRERSYDFRGPDQLIEDFYQAIEQWRAR